MNNDDPYDGITPITIAFDCIPKSRGIGEEELIVKYNQKCKRHNVLPLWGQLVTALKRLKKDGKITYDKEHQTVRKL